VDSLLLHPIFVHYPIAFYFLELVLISFWFFTRQDKYLDFARFCFFSAFAATWIAIGTGLFDAGGIKPALHYSGVRQHLYAALAVAAYYTVRLFVWKYAAGRRLLHLLQSTGGIALIALTAYWGGKLVYD
jgi:uncharacterized membrane protein